MILLEEFQKAGTEIIFLNYQPNESPESHLLIQMQGMIAGYEREKSMERYRRGKIHAAKNGEVSVFSRAPYGYTYIDKHMGSGQTSFEICEEASDVVRKIFTWIGQERCTIREAARRLKRMNVLSPKGKSTWNASVIHNILNNPAYIGKAAYGKRKMGPRLPRVRPIKGCLEQPKIGSSYPVEKINWIYISVPAIIDETLFEATQEQLIENRRIARERRDGAKYLLQGLIVCQNCRYAYYGRDTKLKTNHGKPSNPKTYMYYTCPGSEAYRFEGNEICTNTSVRMEPLEIAVWEEVKFLLKHPQRILEEYQRRINELEKSPLEQTYQFLNKQKSKLQRGIDCLIDGYTHEHIDKEEFEPRIRSMKQRLKTLEDQMQKIMEQKNLKNELTLIVTNIEHFASVVIKKLDNVDWNTKREIIRSLVKRIEINHENVNIVFRVNELPDPSPKHKKNFQHCPACRDTEIVSRWRAA